MVNRCMKRCSASLIIRECKSKSQSDMTSHLSEGLLSKRLKISVGEDVEKREPMCICWWECILGPSVWKTVWMFLKKLKVELPYDPVVPLLGIYPKKTNTLVSKDICVPHVYYSIV